MTNTTTTTDTTTAVDAPYWLDVDAVAPAELRQRLADAYECLRGAMRDSNILSALFKAVAACEALEAHMDDMYKASTYEDGADSDVPWEVVSRVSGYEKVDDLMSLLSFWTQAHESAVATVLDDTADARTADAEKHGLGTIAGR